MNPVSIEKAIVVKDVYKSFGKQVVLNGVSMEIEAGKTTAVVGPSGVGKSVLLKLIMGILEPDAGQIFIGQDCITTASNERERNRIRARMGVLFQSAALFDSLSVLDNVAFPLFERGGMSRREIYENVISMLEALSLERYAARYPEEISMGIRKRVGIARALITEPKIFLFDEPNTGLDPLDGQEVYDLINECRERWKFAGVVISHELPEVFQVSDRVVLLLDGKVVEEGTPTAIKCSGHPAVQQFLQGITDGPIKIH